MITIKRSFPKKKKGEEQIMIISLTAGTAYELYALIDIFDFFNFEDNPWDKFTSVNLPDAMTGSTMSCVDEHSVELCLEISDLTFSIEKLMTYIEDILDNMFFNLEFDIQN